MPVLPRAASVSLFSLTLTTLLSGAVLARGSFVPRGAVTVQGMVVDSNSGVPDSYHPDGIQDQALIPETGQVTSIQKGRFVFRGVPRGGLFTVNVSLYNPIQPNDQGGYGVLEVAKQTVFIPKKFSGNVFHLPTMQAAKKQARSQLAKSVTLQGVVLDSGNRPVNQLNPEGFPDQVVVVSTGQVATIHNGRYTIPSVPTGRSLELAFHGYNPNAVNSAGGFGVVEFGRLMILPHSAQGPVFQVPLMQLQAK